MAADRARAQRTAVRSIDHQEGPKSGLLARISSRRLSPFEWASLSVAVVLGIIALYPLLRVILGLFVDGNGLTIAPLIDAASLPGIGITLVNTVVVVVASAILALALGGAFAWLNERTDARIGTLTDSLPLIPFLLPPIAGAVGWLLLLSPAAGYLNWAVRGVLNVFGANITSGPLNISSVYGLIFVYTLYQVPYAFLIISNALRNVDSSLDEQSHICGASTWATLWRVTLPSVRQSFAAAWFLMMLQGFSLFSIPEIIGSTGNIDILSVRIVNLMTVTFPPKTGAAVGLSLVIVVVVGATWVWQLRILKKGHHAALTGKGQRAAHLALGRWRWVARFSMLGYGVIAAVLPAAALVLVALNGYWTTAIRWDHLGLTKFISSVFGDTQTLTALRNSLWIGVVGATAGMTFAALASLFVQRRKSRLGSLVDGAIKLPSVFPHLVLAVGFILAFTGPPFHLEGTTLILIMAYISIYVPQGSVAADGAVSQIGLELAEASSVAGSAGGRTFRRIYLPLMLPGLLTGWAFLFARMVGDLTATALLAGPGNTVVGFQILQIFSNGTFAELASLSIALTLMSSVVVIAVLAYARHREAWRHAAVRNRRNRVQVPAPTDGRTV